MSANLVQSDAGTRQSADPPVSMSAEATPIRVLVALASYGNRNEQYLSRVIEEYRSIPYQVHLVVLSNIPRDLGPDIEVRVGLPDKNPWSLPFAHKQLFAERIDDYDLFIYAEDDILITQRNIEAFLAASRILPQNVIAGFVHAETDDQGNVYFDPVHSHFHWDPASVRSVGDYTLAFYTNEHSACYVLTREQLKRAIRSGGFLLAPYEGRYDMLCTAATDPYTRCGFRKMICVSHLEDFSVQHLPNNKHVIRPFRASSVFHRQIEALLNLEPNGRPCGLLFDPETKVLNAKWSKDYYEPVREEVISLIPASARNVLSLGCGWGATERRLVEQGHRVVGVPMDSVIGACSEDAGVEMVYGDFATARRELDQDRFDCILLLNVLHLVPDPVGVLSSFTELLAPGGVVVVATPNFANLVTYWRRLTGDPHHKDLGSYEKSGIHLSSRRVIGKWLKQCGMAPVATREVLYGRAQFLQRASLGLLGSWLASELVIVGRRSK
jgi:2-polyprenyl-3-methyl-5-hydroxy-6-metoxy-1,4-benzoquinol methylase